MVHIVKKSCFTLLELLIVLFITSFGVILTGVKVTQYYQEQRFFSECRQVLSHLAMAQDLMLIMDTDVWFKMAIDPESKKVTCWLEIEKPLEQAWARLIERKVELSAIKSYEFEGRHEGDLTLQFSLGQMSQGVLTLGEEPNHSQSSDKRQFDIALSGYPRPFMAQPVDREQVKGRMDKQDKSKRLYPSEVYEKLYAKSSEKNQEA
jgi:type II secretory pathway pseudopilin PulG